MRTFQAIEMIEEIESAFNNLLKTVEWMDDETRVIAEEKVCMGFEGVQWEQNYTKLNDLLLHHCYASCYMYQSC